MAWNEPGGSGNKDPWSGGNGNQGPPDLDEVVKKMQDKFGSIFGGSKQSSPGGGKGLNASAMWMIIIVILVVWGLSGIYIVDEGKRGVVLQFGKFHSTSLPGPHWYPRFIQTVEFVDIEQIRDAYIGYRAGGGARQTSTPVESESLMLTKDENIVDIQIAIQYKISNAADYLFNIKDPDVTLKQATESAVREIIGKNKMDYVITEGRADIVEKTLTLTQDILDRYETGLNITSVNMQDAQPPEQVQAAFDDAVKAREDNDRKKKEAEAYAKDIIPRAHGKAARQIAEAKAYKEKVIAEANGEANRFLQVLTEYKKAPEVTRKRLYLESIENVLGNTSKIVVDVKGGNNLMYLPLDKLYAPRIEDFQTTPRIEESPSVRPPVDQRLRDSGRGARGAR